MHLYVSLPSKLSCKVNSGEEKMKIKYVVRDARFWNSRSLCGCESGNAPESHFYLFNYFPGLTWYRELLLRFQFYVLLAIWLASLSMRSLARLFCDFSDGCVAPLLVYFSFAVLRLDCFEVLLFVYCSIERLYFPCSGGICSDWNERQRRRWLSFSIESAARPDYDDD